MAMTACKECKKEVSDKAEACPQCGAKMPKKVGFFKGLFALIFVVIGGLIMVGVFMPHGNKVSNTLSGEFEKSINNKVVEDAKEQYEIVKRNGSKIEACSHAQMVSAAYVQAKDEAGLQAWKPTQKKDCRAAGMPEEFQ
jgi:hypothetical protein